MNNDLISRSELKKAIQKLEEEPDYQHEGETWQNGLCMAEILIDNAPTVKLFCAYLSDGEVRQPCVEAPCKYERPQGEWIDQDFDDLKISDYRCNQCGHYQDDITNFCPNCGADMRKGSME